MSTTPPTPEEAADTIADATNDPQSASVDGVSASQVSVSDKIKAEQYRRTVRGLTGNASGWGMLRIARAKPPGSTS